MAQRNSRRKDLQALVEEERDLEDAMRRLIADATRRLEGARRRIIVAEVELENMEGQGVSSDSSAGNPQSTTPSPKVSPNEYNFPIPPEASPEPITFSDSNRSYTIPAAPAPTPELLSEDSVGPVESEEQGCKNGVQPPTTSPSYMDELASVTDDATVRHTPPPPQHPSTPAANNDDDSARDTGAKP